LSAPEAQADAAESLRGLIDKVVLIPGEDGYSIDLRGDLAEILTIASNGNVKTAAAVKPSAVLQVSLVAGVGFEPTTFRL
jgi:site-specific DNA recombinase